MLEIIVDGTRCMNIRTTYKPWKPLIMFMINLQVAVKYLPLQWCHNGRDGVSNHQPHDWLLNRLFRSRSKKTSKLRVTGLCAGNSPATGEFPAQRDSDAENVSIWWRHHDIENTCQDSIWTITWQLLSIQSVNTIELDIVCMRVIIDKDAYSRNDGGSKYSSPFAPMLSDIVTQNRWNLGFAQGLVPHPWRG